MSKISHFTVMFYISAFGISISSMHIEITMFSTQQYVLYGSWFVLVPSACHKRCLNWGGMKPQKKQGHKS